MGATSLARTPLIFRAFFMAFLRFFQAAAALSKAFKAAVRAA
jgi:hypothetical protein